MNYGTNPSFSLGNIFSISRQSSSLYGNFSRYAVILGLSFIIFLFLCILVSRFCQPAEGLNYRRGTTIQEYRRFFEVSLGRGANTNLQNSSSLSSDSRALRRAFYEEYEVPETPPSIRTKRYNIDKLVSYKMAKECRAQICAICLEEYGDQSVSAGHCGHELHTSCLSDWLRKDPKSSCPVCRAKYSIEESEYASESSEEEDLMEDLLLPTSNERYFRTTNNTTEGP